MAKVFKVSSHNYGVMVGGRVVTTKPMSQRQALELCKIIRQFN